MKSFKYNDWSGFQTVKLKHPPTFLVVVLHSDDLTTCGSGTGHNSAGVQGFNGKWVDDANVLPCGS